MAALVDSVVEETKTVLVLFNRDVCPLVSDTGLTASVVSVAEETKAVLVSENGDVFPVVSESVLVSSVVADVK